MKIYDIIAQAACNAGITPSFNIGDVPADIQQNAKQLLENQILPAINNDNTLAVNIAPVRMTPVDHKIVLRSWVGEPECTFCGTWNYPYDTLTNMEAFTFCSNAISPNSQSEPPRELPNRCGFFCKEMWFVLFWNEPMNTHFQPFKQTNIDFVPVRIDSVLKEADRIPYEYLYQSEFESIDYKYNVFTYTMIKLVDGIELQFRDNDPKLILIPIPLRIVADRLVGQPAFNQYIVDLLAFRMAINYQVATASEMKAAAGLSYNLIKKNPAQPIRPVNHRMQIRNILKNGQSKYWRFDSYI